MVVVSGAASDGVVEVGVVVDVVELAVVIVVFGGAAAAVVVGGDSTAGVHADATRAIIMTTR